MTDRVDQLAHRVSPTDAIGVAVGGDLVPHEFGLDDIVEAVKKASDAQNALHVSIAY